MLRVSATNLYYVSENGLSDWIYPDTNSVNLVERFIEEQIDEPSTLIEASFSPDCGDVEWLSRKLQEMAFVFQSRSDSPADTGRYKK